MAEMTYGYARVSTSDQNLDRQLDALAAFGVDEVFADKASGRDFERPEWRRLMGRICAGDVLVVKSIDRLGRSYDENAPEPDRTLAEGDVLRVGTATFTVMETPGHTPGGIVLVGGGSAEGVAFVGDTLFPGSHGRTDLKGGDEATIMASLARMAAEIAPDTTLVCGHGPATTMARELAVNPFLR